MTVKTEKKTIEIDSVVDVICNKCGGTCVLHSYTDKLNINCLVGEIEGGFESTHIQDLTRYKFHLCEKCTKELMDTFAIPAEETNLSIMDTFTGG